MHTTKRIILLFPSIGIIVFFVMVLFAIILYPGGSYVDASSKGYDIIHNYWCDLMNKYAGNGQINPSRYISVPAFWILCLSVFLFFYQFARQYLSNTNWRKSTQWTAGISMFFAILVASPLHDQAIFLGSVFGLWAIIGLIKGIYTSKLTIYKSIGILCLLLVIFNNYVYMTRFLIEILAPLQKISALIVLGWMIGLNIKMSKDIITDNL